MTRNRRPANANTEGVVQEFIGTAYDDIKLVADNLDQIQLVVDAINNLDPDSFATAAQGDTADSALQPEDIQTLGLLNSVVTDATLIDTADARLSDSRDPNAHTHAEVDITDLQTYLQAADIDTLGELNTILTDANLIDTGDTRLSDDRNPLAHTHPYGDLTGMPTTLAGYGITDAYTMAQVDAHTHAFADLTAKPTTLAGYGIVDAAPSSHVGGDIHIDWKVTGAEVIHPDRYTDTDTVYSHPATHPFSMLTGLPTTLVGYGITDNVSSLLNDAGYLVAADINTLTELNLILTDAVLGDAGDYATAAQGALADTAIQPGELTHDGFPDYVADEHLPSATFATAAQGALADTALQSFDVNHDLLDGYVADEHLPSATFATAAQGAKADTAIQPGELTHDGFPDFVADEHLPSSTFATAAQGALADSALQQIDPDSITMDMLVDIPTDTYLGRVSAATGIIEILTNAQLKTALDLTGTNSGDQTDITGISSTKAQFNTALTDGSFAYAGGAFHDGFSDYVADEHMPSSTFATAAQGLLADSALQQIDPDSVSMDMLVDIATDSFLGRTSALTGTVEILSIAQAKLMLGLTGDNTGDQTSIVGITGTKNQFNTAVTDGDFLFVNDITHDGLPDYDADQHLPSATFATAAQGSLADSALQQIDPDSISMDMLIDVNTDTFLGRVSALSGTVEVLTNAQAKTALDLTGVNSGDQTDITGISSTKAEFDTALSDGNFVYVGDLSHDGFADYVADEHMPSATFATAAQGALADSALQQIDPDSVSFDMLVDVNTDTFLGRTTALSGTVEELSIAQAKALLDLTGTNSGDQTDISDFNGTSAEFDVANTDGNFAFAGGAFHDGFSDYVADEHLPSSTFATAAQGTLADSATQPGDNVSTLTNDSLFLAAADINTLAELNAIVGDATLGDTAALATSAQGALADSASQPGHTHLEADISDLQAYLKASDINLLAELNAILSDATLIDTGDSRLSDARTPTTHTHTESEISDLQSYLASTDIDTLTKINAVIGDATLIDTADSRLSDDRDPTAHTHTEAEISDLGIYLPAVNISTLAGLNATVLDATLGDAGDFATAAQGVLADSAVQPADIGTAAAEDVGYFATAAQGALADTAIQSIGADFVTMDMIVDIAADSFLGRVSPLTGTIEVLTQAQAKTALDLTGTNSGDQTDLSGISDTKANFDASVSDASGFVYAGGAFHDTFSDYVADEHLPSSTFATAAQGILADSAIQSADINTLAGLNSIVADATLGDTADFITIATIDGRMLMQGDYDATANSPDLDVSPSGIVKGDTYRVSVAGSFFGAINLDVGDHITALQDDPTTSSHWSVTNGNIDTSDFATSAQGALADSALQPADINTLAELNAIVAETLIDDTHAGLGPDEGTAILSTAETAGKVLTAQGDNSSAWEVPADIEGTDVASTAILVGDVLTADGDGTSSWQTPVDYSSTLANFGEIEGHDGANRGALTPGTNGQVLALDDQATLGIGWADLPTASDPGMVYSKATGNITLNDGNDVFSAAGLTHNLKASPVAGERCRVRDYLKGAGTNAITIQRNGATINGSAADFDVDEDGQIVTFMCDTDGNWITSSVSDVAESPSAKTKVITDATYTVLEADNGYRLLFDRATAIAVTLPDGLSLNHHFSATQVNTGVPTITPVTDTVNGAGTGVTPDNQWGSVYFVQYAFADWMAEYSKAGSYLELP